MKLILGTASPRRHIIFRQIGASFDVAQSNIEEPQIHTRPEEHVLFYAKAKAEEIIKKLNYKEDYLLIASDTLVWFGERILGKPKDEQEAKDMLRMLSGQKHVVYTGVYFYNSFLKQGHSFYETSNVYFKELDDEEIDWYVGTGEPMDKAGSYGIQGYGSLLVKKIDGCYFNVMGFPISRFYSEIRAIFPELDFLKVFCS